MVLGMICLVIMPKSPSSAFFLKASERQLLTRILAEDDVSTETSGHSGLWCELRHALMQPHVLLNAFIAFLLSTCPLFLLPVVPLTRDRCHVHRLTLVRHQAR